MLTCKIVAARVNRWRAGGPPLNFSGEHLQGLDLRGLCFPEATFTHAVMTGADLRCVSLYRAEMEDADLRGANLTEANLSYVEMEGANLEGADLTRVNLIRANLRHTVLRGAILIGADLDCTFLEGADLEGAVLPEGVPVIPNIDAAILRELKHGGTLYMLAWHSASCDTVHCRAGWAVHLAGDAGRELERRFGAGVAGALIYAASGSHPTPDWHAKHQDALADLQRRAART